MLPFANEWRVRHMIQRQSQFCSSTPLSVIHNRNVLCFSSEKNDGKWESRPADMSWRSTRDGPGDRARGAPTAGWPLAG